ncbi:MAG: NYN domain-containing protein [Chloroflexi bacterium]|nr:NYN domain-containing protein [Chloroflexota bacterium]
MNNDVAIYLDLDNLVIGAKQANLTFDINLILDEIKRVTNGRIVLRRSYGDWRQGQKLLKELAIAGFTTQASIRLNNFSKNLADMQIVVDTMDTLVDGHQYNSYVLITGDRDFTPLVQSLQKRGKYVIGVGVKHTASSSLVGLCDHYIYYEQLLPSQELTEGQMEALLTSAMEHLLNTAPRVRASVLKQYMSENSNGAFDRTPDANGSFRKFLSSYSHIVEIEQEETTIYVRKPRKKVPTPELHLRYRSLLKKQKLRIVPASTRFKILRDMIMILSEKGEVRWRELVGSLASQYEKEHVEISKNLINAMMLVARRAHVLRIRKGKSLSTAPVSLKVEGAKPFQEAVVRCDKVYLREILELSESFDIEEVALALYDTEKYAPYLQKIMKSLDDLD